MSKPVKEMIVAEYNRRFEDIDSAVVIEIRGMDANDNNNLRGQLAKRDIRVTIVKNTLAAKAFSGGPLEGLAPALSGPSAVVTGADSVVDVARELVRCAKEFDALELKAAILDGEFFREWHAGWCEVRALRAHRLCQDTVGVYVTSLPTGLWRGLTGVPGSPRAGGPARHEAPLPASGRMDHLQGACLPDASGHAARRASQLA